MITAITFFIFNRPSNFGSCGANAIDGAVWIIATITTVTIDICLAKIVISVAF